MIESLLSIMVVVVVLIALGLGALALTGWHAVTLIKTGDLVSGIIGLVILAVILKVLF